MKTIVVKKERRKKIQNKIKFSIYIPPQMLKEIKADAKAEGRSTSQQAIYYLSQHVTAKDSEIPDYAVRSELKSEIIRR